MNAKLWKQIFADDMPFLAVDSARNIPLRFILIRYFPTDVTSLARRAPSHA